MARSAKTGTPDVGILLEKFESYLQHKTLKLTSQRRQILAKIVGMQTHFTADDLVDAFRSERPRVSKATCYRTLSLLTDARIVEEHNFGEAYRVYEVTEGREHHDHLCCTDCGRIIEFASEAMELLQDKIARGLKFHPRYHSQNIYGICRECWAGGAR